MRANGIGIKKMFLSAYTLSYGNWTVIPSHWDRLFGEIRENGFDAVDLSFSESEEMYAMRTIEQQIAAAHKHGLMVLIVPSRFAGRFAGAPFMAGGLTVAHPEWNLPGHHGCACVDVPEVVEATRKFFKMIVSTFACDGIIIDEPKNAETPSSHPATIARYGREGTVEDARRSMLEYIGGLVETVKACRPELSVTIFNMPQVSPEFTARCASLPGVDYAGFDGTLCSHSYFHGETFRSKPPVGELWERAKRECAGKCGTFTLIENMLIPSSENGTYERELNETLPILRPDHLACYCYGHGNEDAEYIQKVTIDALKKYIVPFK